jgi:hypothetical protein
MDSQFAVLPFAFDLVFALCSYAPALARLSYNFGVAFLFHVSHGMRIKMGSDNIIKFLISCQTSSVFMHVAINGITIPKVITISFLLESHFLLYFEDEDTWTSYPQSFDYSEENVNSHTEFKSSSMQLSQGFLDVLSCTIVYIHTYIRVNFKPSLDQK